MTNHESGARPTEPTDPTRAGWGPWRIAGAAGFGLFALSGFADGWGGAVLGASLYLAATALWALVRKRSWLGPMRRRGAVLLLACGLVGLVVGSAAASTPKAVPTTAAVGPTVASTADAVPEPTPTADVASVQASATPQTALAAVALLEVKGRAPKTGYDRDQFGPAWKDVDRNGCDTRNDILRRDLTAIVLKPGTQDCVVATGTLQDPYSGRAIAFVRGEETSSAVQIDHVVALSDAWQKGAQAWDLTRRETFGNDPLNLLAVDGPLNTQKGDGDAATWLPPNKAFRCAYVARQVGVKYSYGLWVTAAERDAMVRVLSTCPNEPLPTASTVPPPVVVEPVPAAPDPAPAAPAPATPAPDVYYKNCDAARAAGAAPVHRGDPGYAPRLDGDGDGIGCE
ncbi:GmrSD restriction endonuclease domain-containing protein [Cellulomonas sp. McL0617]|uniref:GmrSD restriction endonuclease domain-containing protein n=1 Tax=Cellulomonas sp. McL0617 TaxID=3415675 RepID=UPI003CE90990